MQKSCAWQQHMPGMEYLAWLYTSTQFITTIRKLSGPSPMTKEMLAVFGGLRLYPGPPPAPHWPYAASLTFATTGILGNAPLYVLTVEGTTLALLQAVISLINHTFTIRQRLWKEVLRSKQLDMPYSIRPSVAKNSFITNFCVTANFTPYELPPTTELHSSIPCFQPYRYSATVLPFLFY